ncbi:MAG: aminoacyl-tRNA hydrolase [Candidatus Kapabacteria bacterium]|nr:aminoacyl-tRNA hydrolase [Candidatus Kapabacteria bacterium]
MVKYEYIIAGLGNIGSEYCKTRHNIGFMIIDELAKKYNLDFSKEQGKAFYTEWKYAGKFALLIKPTTFMNLSGQAILNHLNKNEGKSDEVIVIVDEYNFPLGRLHFKNGGSDGGHNGLKSIMDELNNSNFYKLRCGIDKNFNLGGLVDYVLGEFEENEQEKLEKMIKDGVKALEYIMKSGKQRAMSDINSAKIFEPITPIKITI